jgi:hypothetical protein
MNFQMKFLDGSPVPESYSMQLSKLLSEAMDNDPGEFGEADYYAELNHKGESNVEKDD